ncbi:MAG: hypothetical protein QOE70_1013 [Chthoniobacter sp.]|jgi:S-adenosylmethionine-diacylglycerol 3-amino-3-carboxypropyl transferase|nr:hypothetical protein [Chthoniobacter sp.]
MEPIDTADAWARDASRLPVAFSQVREDPALDATLLAELSPEARVFMIASGGDTAAWLAASGHASHLQLVDINPAQLALARVKLHLLRHFPPADRLDLLGHRPMAAGQRALALGPMLAALGLSDEVFGPAELVARLGPDCVGRYEILFGQLQAHLGNYREDLSALLTLSDPAEQTRRTAAGTPLGQALDEAFETVMRLENLVCLFGEEATRNSQRSFARHFAARTRHALATLPAHGNPFLAQILIGSFPDGAAYPWLDARPPQSWPEIACTCSTAIEALAALPRESVDLIHLSNILDWLSPEAAAETLSLAWNALRAGGLTIIRQLNSSLEIPAFEPRFAWRSEQAEALHRQDRSFFYRALHIGARPA